MMSRYLWHQRSTRSHIISIHHSKIDFDKNISKTKLLHETYSFLSNKYLDYQITDASSLVKVFWEQPQAYKECKKKPRGNIPASSVEKKWNRVIARNGRSIEKMYNSVVIFSLVAKRIKTEVCRGWEADRSASRQIPRCWPKLMKFTTVGATELPFRLFQIKI